MSCMQLGYQIGSRWSLRIDSNFTCKSNRKVVPAAAAAQLLLVAHYTAAAIKPRSVATAAVQANYLAVAPG